MHSKITALQSLVASYVIENARLVNQVSVLNEVLVVQSQKVMEFDTAYHDLLQKQDRIFHSEQVAASNGWNHVI
ncbi:MAG: hypothetical protein ACE3JU_11515 [Paenibacillus sp.]|uniref:hypothetical protein n=1 Tax=Paenibacillus sp. TaxID=58172 RepID=UPI003B77D2EA